MDATELVHLPDGTILDPVAIAAIYPPNGDIVSFQLLGAAESLGVIAESKAHAEELHAYLVACKTLSKRGDGDGDGPRAVMDNTRRDVRLMVLATVMCAMVVLAGWAWKAGEQAGSAIMYVVAAYISGWLSRSVVRRE